MMNLLHSWIKDIPDLHLRDKSGFFPGKSIRVQFSQRDPFEALPEQDKDMMVVAMYAWDGNAFPGESSMTITH